MTEKSPLPAEQVQLMRDILDRLLNPHPQDPIDPELAATTSPTGRGIGLEPKTGRPPLPRRRSLAEYVEQYGHGPEASQAAAPQREDYLKEYLEIDLACRAYLTSKTTEEK